jgi:hypothetical protein
MFSLLVRGMERRGLNDLAIVVIRILDSFS